LKEIEIDRTGSALMPTHIGTSAEPHQHSCRPSSGPAHLAERLTGLHDGQPKVFRDSAVENLREFFERFRRLNIRSSPELDALVEEAQQVITGIEPQQLRDSVRLRQMVARDFEQIQASVGEMLVDRPRRNILRRGNVGGAV
jgi:hypothetical protein